MQFEVEILLGSVVFGVFGFLLSVVCFFKQRRQAKLLNMADYEVESLTETMAKIKDSFELNSKRLSEQSRHIAWLETRIRQPKLVNDRVLQDESIHETPKATMTERRHRVITLASRGQNASMIAAALGMLQGEVELIMSLNQAAARYKTI